ncbi:MAG: tetratricopeptide repeat protein [Limisphaerales bacterium]
MAKRTATAKATSHTAQCFAELLSRDPELSALRADDAQKPATKRRAAAEWEYDESISNSLFGTALARLQGEGLPAPEWPSGFAALAIDPEYAPALLTVGCYEHGSGRKAEGLWLLLQLTQLPPNTADWFKITDKAGLALMDAGDAAGTCRLYKAALEASRSEQEFIIGLGWALCRAGKQEEALPWLERAVTNAPHDYSVLNDYGWGLAELGRYDEARKALEKAVQLAPVAYDLPANNLKRLQQLRENARPQEGTRQIQ